MDKIKESVISLIAVVGLLIFISFMFIHNNEVNRVNLIREDVYNDSLIMEEHKRIKQRDSQYIESQKHLKEILDSHEKRLYKIEKWKSKIIKRQNGT
jgi:hypothetical protein